MEKHVHCNYSKLRGRIKEIFNTQGELAKQLHITEQSLSSKLNGKQAFKQSEILRLCELLTIPNEKIGLYFFNNYIG